MSLPATRGSDFSLWEAKMRQFEEKKLFSRLEKSDANEWSECFEKIHENV